MSIEIRPIQTHGEYRAVEQLQRDIWHLEEVEIIPDHLLLTAQKNGGLVLGAFEGPTLAGFVFGFAGLTADGSLKHCSHMTGVLPDYQNRNLGYRLKLAQREAVLAWNIDLITWTFDPLESRNARLNFHKLGATCNTYLADLYGGMRDGLNVGLPSDRFQVDWQLSSPRAKALLRDGRTSASLAQLLEAGATILNPPQKGSTGLSEPASALRPIDGPRLLLAIPPDFQAIKSADMALARRWRSQTRQLFQTAFARGYLVSDLLFDGQRSTYLLDSAF